MQDGASRLKGIQFVAIIIKCIPIGSAFFRRKGKTFLFHTGCQNFGLDVFILIDHEFLANLTHGKSCLLSKSQIILVFPK